jgi:hypothetical protein
MSELHEALRQNTNKKVPGSEEVSIQLYKYGYDAV